jgi:cytidylate kinase
MIVAIDGPAGSGKSTVASKLAERLGFRYLDTGAMYRALTWVARRDGADLADGPALAALAELHPVSFGDHGGVEVDGEDVTAAIREADIDRLVPSVARHPEVRDVMRERQRALAVGGNSVIEGRDIGSVVFPDAELKVYLTAHPEVRASRRAGEVRELDYEVVAADLARRDALDQGREHSPLTQADDAVTVDTTDRGIDQIVDEIMGMLG